MLVSSCAHKQQARQDACEHSTCMPTARTLKIQYHLLPYRFYIEQGQKFQVNQFPDAVYMKCHQSPEAPAWSLQTREFYLQYKMIRDQAFSQDHPCLAPQQSVSTYLQNV